MRRLDRINYRELHGNLFEQYMDLLRQKRDLNETLSIRDQELEVLAKQLAKKKTKIEIIQKRFDEAYHQIRIYELMIEKNCSLEDAKAEIEHQLGLGKSLTHTHRHFISPASALSAIAFAFFGAYAMAIFNLNHDENLGLWDAPANLLYHFGLPLYLMLDDFFTKYHGLHELFHNPKGYSLVYKGILAALIPAIAEGLVVASGVAEEGHEHGWFPLFISVSSFIGFSSSLMSYLSEEGNQINKGFYTNLYTGDRIIINDENLSWVQKAAYLIPTNLISLVGAFGMTAAVGYEWFELFEYILTKGLLMDEHAARPFALSYGACTAATFFIGDYYLYDSRLKNLIYNYGADVLKLYQENKILIGISLILLGPTLSSAAARYVLSEHAFDALNVSSNFTTVFSVLVGASALAKFLSFKHLSSIEVIAHWTHNQSLSHQVETIKAQDYWRPLPKYHLSHEEKYLAEMQKGPINASNLISCSANFIGNFTSALAMYNVSESKAASYATNSILNLIFYMLLRPTHLTVLNKRKFRCGTVKESFAVLFLIIIPFFLSYLELFDFGAENDQEVIISSLMQSFLMMVGNQIVLHLTKSDPKPKMQNMFTEWLLKDYSQYDSEEEKIEEQEMSNLGFH